MNKLDREDVMGIVIDVSGLVGTMLLAAILTAPLTIVVVAMLTHNL